MFFAGLAIYLSQTKAKDRTGQLALWSLVALLVFIWLSAIFGPPPPSVNAVKYSALCLWLIVAWAYWVDRHRYKVKVD